METTGANESCIDNYVKLTTESSEATTPKEEILAESSPVLTTTGPVSTDKQLKILPISLESDSKEITIKTNDKVNSDTLKDGSNSVALSSKEVDSKPEVKKTNTLTDIQKPKKLIDSDDSDSEPGSPFSLDSEDDASDESSESTSSEENEVIEKDKRVTKAKGAKSKFSVLDCFGKLPPLEDLHICVKEEECLPFGKVYSIVETLVVIESLPDVPALNLDSVLFSKGGVALGAIFDIFGPVKRPYYTIRFKDRADIDSKSLSVGTVVFCAPKTKYTELVLIHHIASMKGSDASWSGDMEVPVAFWEYSDDEEEKKAKRKGKIAKRNKGYKMQNSDVPSLKASSFEEKMNQRNTLRNQMFIRNPSPDRKPEWFKTPARSEIDNPGVSGGSIIRTPHFTPPSLFHQVASSRTQPSSMFMSQNFYQLNPSFPFNAADDPHRNVFNIWSSPHLPPRRGHNFNENVFFNERPLPASSPSFPPNFQGNNNNLLMPAGPSFNQQNTMPFQQCPGLVLTPPPLPVGFPVRNQTIRSERDVQYVGNTNSSTQFPSVRSPPHFQPQTSRDSFQPPVSPLYNRNQPPPPINNSAFQPMRHPILTNNRPLLRPGLMSQQFGNNSRSFGPPTRTMPSPYRSNQQPSIYPMRPQTNNSKNYFPNMPFSNRSSPSQSFRSSLQ